MMKAQSIPKKVNITPSRHKKVVAKQVNVKASKLELLKSKKTKPKTTVNKIDSTDNAKTHKSTNQSQLIKIVKNSYGLNPSKIKKLIGGYQSQSYLVYVSDTKYVLKLQRTSNMRITHYKIQNETLKYLQKNENRFKQKLDYPQLIPTLNKYSVFKGMVSGSSYYIRMLNFLPGKNMQHEQSFRLRNSLARAIGMLHRDVQDIDMLDSQKGKKIRDNNLWVFNEQQKYKIADQLTNHIQSNNTNTNQNNSNKTDKTNNKKNNKQDAPSRITPQKHETNLKYLADQNIYFQQFVRMHDEFCSKSLSKVRCNLSHGDLHRGNTLTDQQGTMIIGIIDFGSSLQYRHFYSDIIYILRTILSLSGKNKPAVIVENICDMLCHYSKYRPLKKVEIECLYFVIGKLFFGTFRGKCKGKDSYLPIRNRLILQFLKMHPSDFIKQLQKLCANTETQDPQKLKRIPRVKQAFDNEIFAFEQQPTMLSFDNILSDENLGMDFIDETVWQELFDEIEEDDQMQQRQVRKFLARKWNQQNMGDKAPRNDLFISWAFQIFHESNILEQRMERNNQDLQQV